VKFHYNLVSFNILKDIPVEYSLTNILIAVSRYHYMIFLEKLLEYKLNHWLDYVTFLVIKCILQVTLE
jgi:hypothetical protein